MKICDNNSNTVTAAAADNCMCFDEKILKKKIANLLSSE